MAKEKFKKGDRVRVINNWASSTLADVHKGEVGTVVGNKGIHYEVVMDTGMEGLPFPWSIPQRGLELIAETKGE